MILIPLTKGYEAMIDDDDFERVMQYNWQVKEKPKPYAKRAVYDPILQNNRAEFLHNFIMFSEEGFTVDHIDRNGLNCQKSNLRLADRFQQGHNHTNSRTKYRGVHRERNGRWTARLMYKGILFSGGYAYDDITDAAKAYDRMAKKYHGEFAILNFPDGE